MYYATYEQYRQQEEAFEDTTDTMDWLPVTCPRSGDENFGLFFTIHTAEYWECTKCLTSWEIET